MPEWAESVEYPAQEVLKSRAHSPKNMFTTTTGKKRRRLFIQETSAERQNNAYNGHGHGFGRVVA
jgi:hypothetical protein